ncbi:MAG TPA: UDP-glucose 4-epimerase GalE [Bdellovibrionota bacterium]|jgi:UDP-glucose 4-epimerase|nr:UDP-glucose 4-epimerase GalE [Bdellovibrionota bacterium]
MAKVLVAGGAGYVGSATCALLKDRGHRVWVLDDLSTGRRELALGEGLTVGQVGDRSALASLLGQGGFDCAMHFAAKSIVSKSFEDPAGYHANNVDQTGVLVEELVRAGVPLIFSSTAAVYGDPDEGRLVESCPKRPTSPYGQTKLAAENLMERAAAGGLRAIALRYFNAAGAEEQLRVGEWHEPETHLIPRLLRRAAEGLYVEVFGRDYPTRDGTCVRDYIHVTDLAEAHLSAMERLLGSGSDQGTFEAFNLGNGHGASVLEVIDACSRALGRRLEVVDRPRRSGDAATLVADISLATRELGFRPKFSLDRIVETARDWDRKRRTLG